MKRILAFGALMLLWVIAGGGPAQAHGRPVHRSTHAHRHVPAAARSATPRAITAGQISSLPEPSPATYQPLADPHLTARQAVDAAEKAFNFTDADLAPAGAVPVVATFAGSGGATYRAWIVVVRRDTPAAGPAPLPGQAPPTTVQVKHLLCVLVDDDTGQVLFAFDAGPIDTRPINS